jgi:hypothetical protein
MSEQGYFKQDGEYADVDQLTLVGSSEQAATFNSQTLEPGDRGTACLTLDVTDVSGGAPTLDIEIQTSADGTTWRAIASFTQATGITSERKSFTGIDRFVRAVCTLDGASTFTFSVSGDFKLWQVHSFRLMALRWLEPST